MVPFITTVERTSNPVSGYFFPTLITTGILRMEK
jgi:hypothetical protein